MWTKTAEQILESHDFLRELTVPDTRCSAEADASKRVSQDCTKLSRSGLIVSAWVVGMPCGNPL